MNASPLPPPCDHTPHIMLIAAETSGDFLGAELVKQFKIKYPDVTFSGFGFNKMQQAGVDIFYDPKKLAIMGVFEAIKILHTAWQALKIVKQQLIKRRPDLIVLIDSPGFNLRVAKIAHKLGIKVLYYVSPQIWAWKYYRIHHIKKYVDHMAVLFKFEEKIYQREQVPVTFVGHPLINQTKASQSKAAILRQYQLNPEKPVIALLPGSRHGEIERLLPLILASKNKLQQLHPELQFILPIAPHLKLTRIRPLLDDDIIIAQHDLYNALSICTAAIAASGTVTLEVALMQIPFVIVYQVNWLNAFIARYIARLHKRLCHVGLCNIVAEMEVAKELLQEQATTAAITLEVDQLLTNEVYRDFRLQQLAALTNKVQTQTPPSEKIAAVAADLLDDETLLTRNITLYTQNG